MDRQGHSAYHPRPRRSWGSHAMMWISAIGGSFGIMAVLWSTSSVLNIQGAAMFIASMGASAVLLFSLPHGALSQPWPVLGGHMVAAAIGVTCAQQIATPYLSASLAVGLAILAMHYLRCLHPPGGATALVAVLGGEPVQQLGYGFLVTPVLVNTLIILLAAILVHLPFQNRRYPHAESASPPGPSNGEEEASMIPHSDRFYALSKFDTFVDVSEQGQDRGYAQAVHHSGPVPHHQNAEK